MLTPGSGFAGAAEWKTLISPAEDAAQDAAHRVVVPDLRSAKAYAKGHIPGAVNAPCRAWRGAQDNPGALIGDARVTTLPQGEGITRRTPVVMTYAGQGTDGSGAAARVYWTRESADLSQIAILNGGQTAWAEAGLGLLTEATAVTPSAARFALDDVWAIDRAGVMDLLEGRRAAVMVDARPVGFFRGQRKDARAGWAGTLAGAINITHESFFGRKARLVADPAEMRSIARTAGDAGGGPELVSFCNTGPWAATNWFALSEVAGIDGVRLHPESMVGWTRFVTQG